MEDFDISTASVLHTNSEAQLLLDEPTTERLLHPAVRGRRLYTTKEHQEVGIPIEEVLANGRLDIYPEVTKTDCLGVHIKGGKLVLQARGVVGIIPLNDRVAIDVHPRASVSNLSHLLRESGTAPQVIVDHLRSYGSSPTSFPSLIEVLASSLLKQLRVVEAHGLMKRYEQTKTTTSFPKGRIHFGDTIQQHWARGNHHRVTASWHDQSVDVAENRCLKLALHLIQQQCLLMDKVKARHLATRLNEVHGLLRGVTLDLTAGFLDQVRDLEKVPHARSYYRDLLGVAISIIEQKGINFKNSTGRVVATSLVLRMDDVFERYLRNTLKHQVARDFSDLRILNGNVAGDGGAKKPLFDTEPSESAQPDIVVAKQMHDGSSQNVLVMDVKYKEKKPERSDINQIVTYAVSYRVKRGVIIQPGGNSKGLQLLGTMGDINLYSYSFDLDRGDLVGEEQDFAKAVSSLVMAL